MVELPNFTGHLSVSLAFTRMQEIADGEDDPDGVKILMVGFIIDLMLKPGSTMNAPHVLLDPTMWCAASVGAVVYSLKMSSVVIMPEAEMGVRRDMVSVVLGKGT